MLDGLFKPRAIAIIGASNNPFSIGHIVIKNLATYGFKGPIFPINPKSSHIRSFKCFKSVLDVPDEIDLVNISVKASLIPQVIEECGQKGVKFAIVHSAGFKEVGEEGIRREREMVAPGPQAWDAYLRTELSRDPKRRPRCLGLCELHLRADETGKHLDRCAGGRDGRDVEASSPQRRSGAPNVRLLRERM